MTLPPKAQAQKDFKGGCGQSDNPYLPGTPQFDEYKWEMARLWNEDFKTSRHQDLVEGTWI